MPRSQAHSGQKRARPTGQSSASPSPLTSASVSGRDGRLACSPLIGAARDARSGDMQAAAAALVALEPRRRSKREEAQLPFPGAVKGRAPELPPASGKTLHVRIPSGSYQGRCVDSSSSYYNEQLSPGRTHERSVTTGDLSTRDPLSAAYPRHSPN